MKVYQNKPLMAAALICALALIGMCLALFLGPQPKEFTPPPFDATACAGTPEVPRELGWGELDARDFQVGICGVVVLDGSTADIWLANPESNNVWLKLRVLDGDGSILGETGLIRPGEYLQSVSLASAPESGMDVVLKIMAYEPETYYSAGAVLVNATIN